ncbi:Rec8 like protein-domain-containing protein [Elsinoe ampelina]|uniref:Rec8 like protein-domain-containing protein n=1 Tax=Elsinoe ampelina TaxID=302913 RepID=A0A6A6GNG0_9PEZI|nr:Rec8 like protein-domain-containing protein [Elsinoe ampelina]
MFYSHEILTSRKYGVATVWLVATLGASEARRKLNKAEIQKVDVPKACETITNPETPLALRLQSNLLFGVSKVYSQQCIFVLNDAEHVRSQVRSALGVIRAATTTSSKQHLGKKDQINLPDDPNFNLELDLLVDLDELTTNATTRIPDSNLESLNPQSSQQSFEQDFAALTQDNPLYSDGISVGENFRSRTESRAGSVHDGPISRLGSDHLNESTQRRLLDDVGFSVGEDGTIIDDPPAGAVASTDTGGALLGQDDMMEDRPAADEIRDHMSDPQLPPLDDFHLFPDAQAFSPRPQQQEQPDVDLPTGSAAEVQQQEDEDTPAQAHEQSAAAPNRAQRQRRTLPLDSQMELRNQDISDWNDNYVQHMQRDAAHRFHQRNAHVARINAQAWLNGAGLLGIGNLLANDNIPAALRMFAGPNILTPPDTPPDHGSPVSSKRARSNSSTSSSRRVRPRLTSQDLEQGRGNAGDVQVPQLDDDFAVGAADEAELPTEVGREAQTPLADRQSSQMPWNLSHGSSAQRRFNLPTGGYGSSSVAGAPLSQGLRGSSIAPSPLLGRDRHAEEEGILGEETFQLPMDDTAMEDAMPTGEDESQLDSQGVRRSSLPWAVKTMDTEQLNFVAFLMDKIDEKRATEQDGQDGQEGIALTFEEAFSPKNTDKVIASQALMHILALNGRNVLKVEQDNDEGFRPISLTVLEGTAPA